MNVNASAKTFLNDLHLPALPLSSVDIPLRMYMDSLDAMMPVHEFMKYKDEVERMLGNDTQFLDFSRSRISSHLKNWIETWWLSWYHLGTDTEILPYSSISAFSNLHKTIWLPDNQSRIARGAQYLNALLIYWNCLRQEIIEPERSSSGEMLSMNMYRNIFNCGRSPTSTVDRIYRHFRTACEGYCPTHICFCIKGYVFKVTFSEKEIIWPLEKISDIITEICELVKERDFSNNVTPATTMMKSQLFAAMKFASNESQFIEEVQQSILWFSFDDSKPPIDHILMSGIGSDAQNRCGIKSLSVSVFANGLIGLNADAALIDPDVFIKVIQFADSHIANDRSINDYPLPFKYKENMYLSPNIYTEYDLMLPINVNNELAYMRRVFNMKVYQMDCSYRYFKCFNTNTAESWNIDPCITVHLLILLTYWEIHGNICAACAIVSHRKYYRGRHDMVPTVTIETINWIKAVRSKKCPPNKLKILFLIAHKKLQKIYKFCENNCGPVLHLNFLNAFLADTSKHLKDLCSDNYWFISGYNGHFGIRTIYLGDVHFVMVIPDVNRFGYSITYSVDEDSTLLSVIHRCSEEQMNPRLPKYFLKEFLSSVELLNQIFTK